MSVDEFGSAVNVSSSELYIADPLGIDVKASPSEYAETIIHLPVNTQVRLMSLNGPEITLHNEWASWDSNWCAIYIPSGTDYENDYQIGWISSPYELWWSPTEFDTSSWRETQLQSYLMSSVWEMEYRSNGSVKRRAVVTFEKYSIRGFEVIPYGTAGLDLGSYEAFSGSVIEIKDSRELSNGNKRLSIRETCFSFDDKNGTYFFKKVNIGSINDMDIFKEYGKESFAIGMLYSYSRHYFRMYSKDYYNDKTVADYALLNSPQQNNLMAVAITYGIVADDYKYKKVLLKYWDPFIEECENNAKRKKYSFNKIKKEADFFSINKMYVTDDKLKLRKTPDMCGEVITVMNSNVFVNVIGYGKMVKIDGMLSVWVKIEVCENATDSSGNPIPSGTTGWCFGAYLSDAG